MNTLREKMSEALYLERYSAGHEKGCDMAIPELRAYIFTKCTCNLREGERLYGKGIKKIEREQDSDRG